MEIAFYSNQNHFNTLLNSEVGTWRKAALFTQISIQSARSSGCWEGRD